MKLSRWRAGLFGSRAVRKARRSAKKDVNSKEFRNRPEFKIRRT